MNVKRQIRVFCSTEAILFRNNSNNEWEMCQNCVDILLGLSRGQPRPARPPSLSLDSVFGFNRNLNRLFAD